MTEPAPKSALALLRRPSVPIAALIVVGIGAGILWFNDTYTRAVWRERSLPELEAEARERPAEKFLLAQLALRQLEAHQYAPAAGTLQNAVTAGFNTEGIWKTMAAATVAGGNGRGAIAVLQLGARDPALAPGLNAALQRLQSVPPTASVEAAAQAISPEGLTGLAPYVAPNALSPWLERWGRNNPERSGFATREAWAREKPDDPAVQVLWARALATNRRFPDAEKILIPLLRKDPGNYEAAITLGDVRYDAGVPARAGIVYRACLKERPNDFRAALGVARCAVAVKLVYLGVESSQKAIQLNPNSTEAWVCLGRAYFNQKLRWDKAVEAFQKAQTLDPGRTDYFAPYYDALRATGKIEEGAKLLRSRIAQAPGDAQAHYLLATALLDLRADTNAAAEAEAALRRSIEIEPGVPSARARLAQVLMDKGDAKEAAGQLEQAVLMDPYHALSRRLLARAYRQLKMTAEAEAIERSAKALDAYIQKKQPLEDAEMANPSDIKIYKQLAKVYREGGETDKAVNAEQMAYMLEHRKEEADRGLKSLMNETNLSASTEWANDKPASNKTAPSKTAPAKP